MDVSLEGSSSISRNELFAVWVAERDQNKKGNAVLVHVCAKFGINEHLHNDRYTECAKKVNIFLTNVRAKWSQVNRTARKFRSKYSDWLKGNIEFESPSLVHSCEPSRLGRPLKDFFDLNDQSKRKRLAYLIENYTHEELAYAARASLHAAGHRDVASIIKDVTETSPENANQIKKSLHTPKSEATKYAPNEALALLIDGGLSKNSYIIMQQGAKKRNANIYPPYNVVLDAKKQCYPINITVSDTEAEVELQALLNHTMKRIALVQQEVLTQNMEHLRQGLTLIVKWGCDGSSGHSNYKQRFEGDEQKSDSSLFSVFLVPLQLKTNDEKVILWNNCTPSSTRFCRPIKLSFEKETAETTKKQVDHIERQIAALQASVITVCSEDVNVKFSMNMTMIDGKTFGVVSDSSVQTCGICKATPKVMNNLEDMYQRESDEAKFKYGLSSLHAYIRCLECILHIAYRKDIKTWRVTGHLNKTRFEEMKKTIQQNIKQTMHMNVDIPKQGFGTSNDGNTASRFFEQYTLAASATGIDEELIRRFGIILNCISSGFSINYEAFADYTKETARRYVELYPWYPMPSSVHKLLIHGPEIIKSCSLPIGMMSEEALEARNKDCRRYREFRTRKMSRKDTMQDLLNSLLFSSDPLISSLSKENKRVLKNRDSLNEDVLRLLE